MFQAVQGPLRPSHGTATRPQRSFRTFAGVFRSNPDAPLPVRRPERRNPVHRVMRVPPRPRLLTGNRARRAVRRFFRSVHPDVQ